MRFTLSHHTDHPDKPDHFDLMLEAGDALKTWSLAALDATTARRIQDHRKAYLDYEGPISGGRGEVRIVDTGTYSVEEWTDGRVVVILEGRTFRGRMQLVKQEDQWRVTR